ncbi:MAG: chromate resistance protein [Candidatus Omnitrophica bacterium]|nr:chromate resistance protein [Candidatus Omnitrophota bacterium]
MGETYKGRWLMLIHQLPPKPNYFRVKIWRRLQQLGAVAIKNSVYVLPNTDQSHESFEWIMREITAGKGEASLCETQFVEGLRDHQIEALFKTARTADYTQIVEEARQLAKAIAATSQGSDRPQHEGNLVRLKRRLAANVDIDFFQARGRGTAESLLREIEERFHSKEPPKASQGKGISSPTRFKAHTWVTRKDVYIDRMASAWLIRRFLDPRARFKFVEGKIYQPKAKEVRFDMFEAEFTHEGDQCTFEVLMERAHLNDPALREIAEIVHEIDLKDGKFFREDVVGFERVFAGIVKAHKDDHRRRLRSAAVLDDAYAYFKQAKQ